MDYDLIKNVEEKQRDYKVKFDQFRKMLAERQQQLRKREKKQLYRNSLKTGDLVGLHIFNNFIDLEYGLIEL